MQRRAHAAVIVVAAALLIGGVAFAQPPTSPAEGGPAQGPAAYRAPEPMISLTGMLHGDGAGGFTLVDQTSGESIVLKKKAKKLEKLDGKTVMVTGRWKGDESSKTFKVSKVEEATAAPQSTETVAPAQEPATQSPASSNPQEPASP
jgi:hypothetical protein